MARRKYRDGAFGEFRLGTACLMEKWYYRHSNFQNWCTSEHSDAFAYIGCHYVDLVHFITGLLPVSVSVYGVKDEYPNGNDGFLWTDARVIWSNGACLNVQNSLSFPDDAPGTNTQGLNALLRLARTNGALILLSLINTVVSNMRTRPGPKRQEVRSIPNPVRITSNMSTSEAAA